MTEKERRNPRSSVSRRTGVFLLFRGGSDLIDLDQIGVARVTRGVIARDDDAILFCQAQLAAGDLLCSVEEDVGGGELLAHSGDNAPGERKLAPGSLVGGETYNVNGRAEA